MRRREDYKILPLLLSLRDYAKILRVIYNKGDQQIKSITSIQHFVEFCTNSLLL
jgi:hypothetical protein